MNAENGRWGGLREKIGLFSLCQSVNVRIVLIAVNYALPRIPAGHHVDD